MTEGIQKPNCGNCSLYDDCPLSCIVISKVSQRQLIVDTVGCLIHPKAREYLMQDVINDLMGIASVYRNENDDYANGIEKAIALIRDGVK